MITYDNFEKEIGKFTSQQKDMEPKEVVEPNLSHILHTSDVFSVEPGSSCFSQVTELFAAQMSTSAVRLRCGWKHHEFSLVFWMKSSQGFSPLFFSKFNCSRLLSIKKETLKKAAATKELSKNAEALQAMCSSNDPISFTMIS